MGGYLQNQVHIYSLDTSAFYTEKEQSINRKILKSVNYRKYLNKNKDNIKNSQTRIKYINKRIQKLKTSLKSNINSYDDIRELDVNQLRDNNIISIFESSLTRTLGVQTDNLTKDIIVVRVYYFQILKNLIDYGFVHNGERYIYFSSSAGQIRTKKGVFIKESQWEKYKNTLTCGLSVEEINANGGANINKYLAYIALTNSASELWEGFDIDRCIVVDDLETNVNGEVDYINRDTYEITRRKMDIPIEHTDGAGMILPKLSNKSFMTRLPFVKGLLVPFPYDEFIKEKGGKSIIKDIYGKEWDIFNDNIQVIFTKSQFKMWKYYDSWEDYKSKFKKFNCQASMLNEEEDDFKEARLNYQMLQSLTDIKDSEIEEITQNTVDDILEIGSDKDVMLRILGATKNEKYQNFFQKSLSIYPELLNDTHARQIIKDVKKSLVKDAKAGKVNISGKYTFICPDMYAFCEYLFLDEEKPKGLLGNDEVYCDLFDDGKLDMLRSPHLYREHGIKNNVKDKEKSKWFITHGIYTSIYDTISKLLQFDVDGDKALVVDDPTFVNIAERNMKGIVPLYYEMAVAEKQLINNKNIYDSLILAFHANIGIISNNISKIWNSKDVNLNAIKWLCMENNFVIDYAKTLYMPKRPQEIEKIIKGYTSEKLPHFFVFAKDKKKKNVKEVNNSVINKLNYIIPNKPIQFTKIAGKFDYKMLMKNKNVKTDKEIIDLYAYLDKNKKWMMKENEDKYNSQLYIIKEIRRRLLSKNSNVNHVVDNLVKYLYLKKKSSFKSTLWDCFGDVLYQNLRENIKNTIECESCGIRTKKKSNRTKYCESCWREKQLDWQRNSMNKRRKML